MISTSNVCGFSNHDQVLNFKFFIQNVLFDSHYLQRFALNHTSKITTLSTMGHEIISNIIEE